MFVRNRKSFGIMGQSLPSFLRASESGIPFVTNVIFPSKMNDHLACPFQEDTISGQDLSIVSPGQWPRVDQRTDGVCSFV